MSVRSARPVWPTTSLTPHGPASAPCRTGSACAGKTGGAGRNVRSCRLRAAGGHHRNSPGLPVKCCEAICSWSAAPAVFCMWHASRKAALRSSPARPRSPRAAAGGGGALVPIVAFRASSSSWASGRWNPAWSRSASRASRCWRRGRRRSWVACWASVSHSSMICRRRLSVRVESGAPVTVAVVEALLLADGGGRDRRGQGGRKAGRGAGHRHWKGGVMPGL